MKKNKLISNIISIVINILIGFVIILIIFNLILSTKSKLGNDSLPNIFGYKFLVELSDSMAPTINAGDLLIIKDMKNKNYQKGDIISYRYSDDVIVTHRIKNVYKRNNNECYKTKGDNNDSYDTTLVKVSQVEGKLVLNLKRIGNFCMFLTSGIGLVTVFLVIVVLFLIDYFIYKIRVDERLF